MTHGSIQHSNDHYKDKVTALAWCRHDPSIDQSFDCSGRSQYLPVALLLQAIIAYYWLLWWISATRTLMRILQATKTITTCNIIGERVIDPISAQTSNFCLKHLLFHCFYKSYQSWFACTFCITSLSDGLIQKQSTCFARWKFCNFHGWFHNRWMGTDCLLPVNNTRNRCTLCNSMDVAWVLHSLRHYRV